MLNNLILILSFTLATFVGAMILYPLYIKLLKKLKAGKTIRSNTATWDKAVIFSKLHEHKAWTPTMGWGLFLLMMVVMVGLSRVSQKLWWTNYHLWNRQETYIILFWFFSMWLIGLIDDILNILNVWKVKWLNMRAKMLGLILFSGWISYWFYHVLWIDYINLAPLFPNVIHLWRWFPILTFIATIFIVNAVNITDWLDW
jgi:UDP-N-acetylmuramyl pentapeptide phosphotransferase/UDP-N-acetylglucosamine-1-phosphate transferase